MTSRRTISWLITAYLAAVVIAACVAVVRFTQSTEMPGLAALELVLLTLPWSLGLGVAPLSRLGWFGMVAIIIVGIGINVCLLWRMDQWRSANPRSSPRSD